MNYEQTLPTFTALMKAQSTPLPIAQVMRDSGRKTSPRDALALRNRLMGFKERIVEAQAEAAQEPIGTPASEPQPAPVVVVEQYHRDVLYVGTEPVHILPLSHAETIIREVLQKHKISKGEFLSHRRERRLVIARQEAAWRMSRETALSLLQIGKKIGGRDHTTIIHAIRQHAAMLRGEKYIARTRSCIPADQGVVGQ